MTFDRSRMLVYQKMETLHELGANAPKHAPLTLG
jgi:hypothetical protein